MALTEDLTFQLGSSGVVLNTDSSGLPFVDVASVTGLDNAPFRETIRDHEGQDGSFIDAEFEKGREIVITGSAYASTGNMEAYLDNLKANYAPTKTLQQFFVRAPGVGTRFLYVKSRGCQYDWESSRRFGETKILFKLFAEDPRLYAENQVSVNIPFSAGAATGFGFNLGFSFGFGAAVTNTGTVVNNLGNRPTPPTFVVNGPCQNPSIIDETYGHTLTFNIILAAGETLTIDTQYKTVKLNNSTNKRSTLFIPDWFYLQPGNTSIKYSAIVGAGSSLDVKFYSAWR